MNARDRNAEGVMIEQRDVAYMAQAIQLAERGRYTTQPNPRVGCIIVAGEEIVGRGWHMAAGQPHAEVYALREAGARAKGATAYITLEPCSHHGRTAPCTDSLIKAGVQRVVAAMRDPNPLVSGQGFAQLREAKVDVSIGIAAPAAMALNAGYIRRMESGRPKVTVKIASSLDGRTAMADGESRWITGESARADVQRLRAASGAVMTGVGTVISDDPSLNVRLGEPLVGPLGEPVPWHQPLRVVLDSRLRISPRARMLTLPGSTLIYTASADPGRAGALEEAGASVRVTEPGSMVNVHSVLADLAAREVNDVLVESGPHLAGSLIEAHLVDEIVMYFAPHLMGDNGLGAFHLPSVGKMSDRVPLVIEDIRAVGRDWRVRARPDYGEAAVPQQTG